MIVGLKAENSELRRKLGETRVRLRQAEEEMSRVTELHAKNLVNQSELDQARSAVELAKAEILGDVAEVSRIRLRQAEADLQRASELRKQNLISGNEYEELKLAHEILKVELDKALQRKTAR